MAISENLTNAKFPWRGLIYPPLVPFVLIFLATIAHALGSEFDHGTGGLIILAVAISTIIAIAFLIVRVPHAIGLLINHPNLRTPWNWLCIVISVFLPMFLAISFF